MDGRTEQKDREREGLGEILSVSEASSFLSIHRNTLYRLIHSGDVPAFRLSRGGPWKFRKGDLFDWIEVKQTGRRG
jgi:excisionase family DNA binding protein